MVHFAAFQRFFIFLVGILSVEQTAVEFFIIWTSVGITLKKAAGSA